MAKYEFLMLANPGITGDEVSNLERHVEGLLKQFQGFLVSFDRWGKCRLAYPIKKQDYGIYYLVRFEMAQPQEFLKEMRLLLDVKYHDLIVRTAVMKVDKQYANFRPDSVEELPTRNVDQFLRDNKMEGLMGKNDGEGSGRGKSSESDDDLIDFENINDEGASA